MEIAMISSVKQQKDNVQLGEYYLIHSVWTKNEVSYLSITCQKRLHKTVMSQTGILYSALMTT